MSDVLIVGAGSAGSILAERLSGDSSCRVTVLEAGPDLRDAAVATLTADGTALPIGSGSPVARHYPSTLTDDPERSADLVRGHCVGGSGAVNGGYFCRALPDDAGMLPGWDWTQMQQHFRAVETRLGVRPASGYCVSTAAFISAARQADFWPVGLASGNDGIAAVPLNMHDGIRVGPGAAFLLPALGRPNLRVLADTRVTGLRMKGRRAVGVDATGADGPVRIDADRVVLCAGAIASAQLLLLAGIGPEGTVADLPVGRGFADHPEWVMSTDWDVPDQPRPVLETVLVTGGLEIRPYTTGFGASHTAIGVALMRPRSRGRLSLMSDDPTAAPRIEHRYDSEPDDVADLRRGYELITEVLRTTTGLSEPAWSTSQHLCGTAPMGHVVDDRCRVLGVEALSVIDGSVLAHIPGRGPHASIAMLAHRAAEFLGAQASS